MLRRCVLLLTLLCCGAMPLRAADLVFPADAGVINVKNPATYGSPAGITGAVGNGATDDTAAIRAAIRYAVRDNSRYSKPYFIYLPTGTYLVSDTLESKGSDHVVELRLAFGHAAHRAKPDGNSHQTQKFLRELHRRRPRPNQ